MPDAQLVFKLVGSVLTADVTTESEQSNTQEGYNLPQRDSLQRRGGERRQHVGWIRLPVHGNRIRWQQD